VIEPRTENELQDLVIDLAHLRGWGVAHFRPARTVHGWRTAVSADGEGFPDLVLVRRGRLIFVELKSVTGKLSASQAQWRDWLCTVAEVTEAVDWFQWAPKDWDEIEAVLR